MDAYIYSSTKEYHIHEHTHKTCLLLCSQAQVTIQVHTKATSLILPYLSPNQGEVTSEALAWRQSQEDMVQVSKTDILLHSENVLRKPILLTAKAFVWSTKKKSNNSPTEEKGVYPFRSGHKALLWSWDRDLLMAKWQEPYTAVKETWNSFSKLYASPLPSGLCTFFPNLSLP